MKKPENSKESAPQKTILAISNLHKRYNEGKRNEVHALQGVELTVEEGDMIAIMGSSGCGKTTLLNMIGHLDRRSSGEIIIDGVDTSTLSDSKMRPLRKRRNIRLWIITKKRKRIFRRTMRMWTGMREIRQRPVALTG